MSFCVYDVSLFTFHTISVVAVLTAEDRPTSLKHPALVEKKLISETLCCLSAHTLYKSAKGKRVICGYLLTVKHLQPLNSVDILIKTTLPGYYSRLSQRPALCCV